MLLLEKQTQDEIPFATLQGWINSLYEKQDCPLYDAEQNCRCVVTSPALLADKADSTIWCDFYGGAMLPASYSFLSQNEIDVLTKEGALSPIKKIFEVSAVDSPNLQRQSLPKEERLYGKTSFVA